MAQLEMTEAKDLFLANFERLEAEPERNGRSWLNPLRKNAITRFDRLGLPTVRDEQWRQTNVAQLAKTHFRPAEDHELTREEYDGLKAYTYEELTCNRLVFVNGQYKKEHSSLCCQTDVIRIVNLAEAMASDSELVEQHLGRYADSEKQAFVALNTAFIQDGVFIHIPDGVVVEKPIVIVYVTTGADEPIVTYPRNLIVVGENSQATLIESYVGLKEEVYFTNAVTEVVMGTNAVIDHYKLQQESRKSYHISALQVYQLQTSNFTNHAITFGGQLSRNEIHAVLDGEGIECILNGLYVASDKQLMDTHTKLEHAKPNCHSNELYKGILDDSSTGVFNGYILVQQDAQKTDAIQSNRALLLSDSATINSQPQLEIYADDVKCTHGATVGRVSEEAIFYLRSRGIPLAEARGIMTYAFANEIIDEIKVEPVRTQLERLIFDRFRKNQE